MVRAVLLAGFVFLLGVFVGRKFPHRINPADSSLVAAASAYRCPMHAWVVADQPGQCTVCGMTLTRAGRPSAEICGAPVVVLDPAAATVIGVHTVAVTHVPLLRTLRVGGTFAIDATRRRYLTAWADGRIDKFYVPTNGAEIRAGEPLMALFSRTLLSAQTELLLLATGGQNSTAAIAEQRQQMMQLGFSAQQLDDLIAYREPSSTPLILARESGTVLTRDVVEGQWVRTGDRLLEIADLSTLWFNFSVPVVDREWMSAAQEIELTTGARTFSAPITFLDPTLDTTSGAVRARAEVNQAAGLAVGLFAEGKIAVTLRPTLVVPRSAVLDSATGPQVWVERANFTYEARPVTLGRRGDTHVEVLGGLAEGERVVTEGALLIDAQAQLTASTPR
ncbi:efflux RND transporter periplasmic adaptor subunit [Oleiharenicola lentus]|uniref:efflux RND transporter periplasmic adaptor subunit n=1 Tax=Oleiharenicola lentus TaxID=2508720 RepID=UPI003F66901C